MITSGNKVWNRNVFQTLTEGRQKQSRDYIVRQTVPNGVNCLRIFTMGTSNVESPFVLYGLRGFNVPRFICWLRHYIKCLLSYLSSPLTFFLAYSLSYLSTSLRIGPFHFQARCRERQRNLALVFFVLILCCRCFVMHACLIWLY